KLESIDQSDIVGRALALERAIKKLVRDNCGNRDVGRLFLSGPPGQFGGCVVQQSDDDVRIEQIEHHLNSLSSAARSWGLLSSQTARTKSSSSLPAMESSQLQSSATGSRITALP